MPSKYADDSATSFSFTCRGKLAERSRVRVNSLLDLQMVEHAELVDAANRGKKEEDIQVSQVSLTHNGTLMLMEDGLVLPYSMGTGCGFNFSTIITADIRAGVTGSRTYTCPQCGNSSEVNFS